MSKPLKDENGNIIMCCFDQQKCGHPATRDLHDEHFGYLTPVCQYHYDFFKYQRFNHIFSYNIKTNTGSIKLLKK